MQICYLWPNPFFPIEFINTLIYVPRLCSHRRRPRRGSDCQNQDPGRRKPCPDEALTPSGTRDVAAGPRPTCSSADNGKSGNLAARASHTGDRELRFSSCSWIRRWRRESRPTPTWPMSRATPTQRAKATPEIRFGTRNFRFDRFQPRNIFSD